MKQAILAIAVVVAVIQLLATSSASNADPIIRARSASVREHFPLTDGWRFKQDGTVRGAEAPEFSDADWGGPLRAVTRSFRVRENDGVLDLRFKAVKGQAIVSAVEIGYAPEPGGPTTQ